MSEGWSEEYDRGKGSGTAHYFIEGTGPLGWCYVSICHRPQVISKSSKPTFTSEPDKGVGCHECKAKLRVRSGVAQNSAERASPVPNNLLEHESGCETGVLLQEPRNGRLGVHRLTHQGRSKCWFTPRLPTIQAEGKRSKKARQTHYEKTQTLQIEPMGESIGLIEFFPVKDIHSVSSSPSRGWSLTVCFSSPLPASFPSPQLWLMCISSSRQSHPRWHIYPSIGVNRNIYKRMLLHLLTSIESWQPFKRWRFER